MATLRKLEFENDAFAFGDRLIAKWYGADRDKKGILIVVTSGKDGALTGGKGFMKVRCWECARDGAGVGRCSPMVIMF